MKDTASATNAQIVKTLNNLIDINRDAQHGYRSAAERIETQYVKSFCLEQSHTRLQFVEELQPVVQSMGEKPDDKGTIVGALRRGWMDLKAALGGGDHAILVVVAAGEEHAVNEYQKALETALPAGLKNILERQSNEVKSAYSKVGTMRDSVKQTAHT